MLKGVSGYRKNNQNGNSAIRDDLKAGKNMKNHTIFYLEVNKYMPWMEMMLQW
jgi:hypothetical protein